MNMQKTIHAVLEAITEVLEQTTTNGNVTSEKLRNAKKELSKAKKAAAKKADETP